MESTAPEAAFEQRLERLAHDWSQDADLCALYLYGSRARRQSRPGSDVDLAVILRADLSPSARWHKRLALMDAAAMALGTDAIDLLLLDEVPSALGHRVIRDGRLLFDREPHRRVQVVEDVLRRYLDEAPLRQALDEALDARLREGRFAR